MFTYMNLIIYVYFTFLNHVKKYFVFNSDSYLRSMTL